MLLEYARIANVYLDALADDEVDLPEPLPANQKSEGLKIKKGVRTPVPRKTIKQPLVLVESDARSVN